MDITDTGAVIDALNRAAGASDPDPWLAGDVVADSGFRFVLGADSGMRV
jgi:hypothetical protein